MRRANFVSDDFLLWQWREIEFVAKQRLDWSILVGGFLYLQICRPPPPQSWEDLVFRWYCNLSMWSRKWIMYETSKYKNTIIYCIEHFVLYPSPDFSLKSRHCRPFIFERLNFGGFKTVDTCFSSQKCLSSESFFLNIQWRMQYEAKDEKYVLIFLKNTVKKSLLDNFLILWHNSICA
jgi:hypothetical protein